MKIFGDISRLIALKDNDPEMYETVVNRVFLLGISAGVCGTIWVAFVAWAIFK